jgi:hypothetical protein
MKKDRIFISGKVSGTDLEETKRKFKQAQYDIYLLCRPEWKSFSVCNPTQLGLTFKDSWLKCMIICLWHLLHCNSIYMLKGWKESDGACLEYWVAKKLGFKIYYQK